MKDKKTGIQDFIDKIVQSIFGTQVTRSSVGNPTQSFTEGGLFPQATPSPYPLPTATSTPTPTVTPTPQQQYGVGYSINDIVPPNTSKLLMNTFDPIQQATNSAQVLRHPMQMTNLPGEQERGVNLGPNRGENPELQTVLDIDNPDGSIDRGLFRINSNTFADFMRRKGNLLRSSGITSYEDMNDPVKNATMAKIIYQEQGWKGWYAAPRNLREG